jgi:Uma2 family endonuclease
MIRDQVLYTTDDLDELEQQPENRDRLLELIYGELHEKVPTEKHGLLAGLFFTFLFLFAEPRKLGYPSIEARHKLPGDKHNARMPDVSFRRATTPLVTRGAVPKMPDLAIEIQSPTDTPRQMREKAAYYLQNGSEIVWLVYPRLRRVEVCTRDENGTMQIQTLGSSDVLTGGAVLPGFTLALREIFDRDILK